MPVTDNLTPLPVKTKTAGDVVVNINQATPGTTNGVVITSALPAGTNNIGSFSINQTTPGTTNGVQITGPGTGSGTPLYTSSVLTAGSAIIGQVSINQTTPGTTNGVQINAALPAGTNTIGNVGLNAGTNIIGQVSINQTTPGTTNGVQITGPGTSTLNPLYVFTTTTAASATLKNSGQVTSVTNIAAGGTGTLTSTLITSGKVGTLTHLIVAASVPMRWDVQTVNSSGTGTTLFSLFSSASTLMVDYKPNTSYPGETQTASGDGVHVTFQVVANNEDNTNAAGAYATFWWTEQ